MSRPFLKFRISMEIRRNSSYKTKDSQVCGNAKQLFALDA